ncbi:glycine betaine/proline transport system ATP-binding protein [Planifilum fulgidum]|uniref:Quaternary amine transport ATP-binding protein n=1 Tax=Planifilum fulgidum TaxID=201973 RepID=A0A1I2QMQ6_9BACL|nr:glycine betaine/L-proline ABC transporter ATP-binding protein [Planifilum fulgidum]SFG27507.1 glycine betaine/proline transport system ATP-binding protein [Planifilum fulgidum]
MSEIIVENVTKVFGPRPESVLKLLEEGASKDEILKKTGHTVGVRDVSFEVKRGEIFVIMGLSGSGKSTLIRCLNLLNRPTRGRITVDGENIVEYGKKQLREFRQNKMAMVFQHFGIFTHRTVLGNVEYGLEVKGVPKEERRRKAREVLGVVGLEGWEDKMPGELSGGMQQRVGLARALATDPDILLMDEPFSALDPLIRREMQLELLEIQSKLKKTIVFITHDVNEAFKLGDRVAVMKDGEMIQIGTPEEILNQPANDYIEEFVKDIDRSRVVQAKHVMVRTAATVSMKDGIRVAVREMESNGISSVFVVDGDRKLQGIVTIDDAIQARKENKNLSEILRKDYHTADPEETIQELIPKAAESRFPIAVVNGSGKLLGIILRVSVLAGLMSEAGGNGAERSAAD